MFEQHSAHCIALAHRQSSWCQKLVGGHETYSEAAIRDDANREYAMRHAVLVHLRYLMLPPPAMRSQNRMWRRKTHEMHLAERPDILLNR
jgi:hypothetical protein